jgi:hypothetical protein
MLWRSVMVIGLTNLLICFVVWAKHVGFVVDKLAVGQVFSEYFGFPCQSSLHQFLHHHNHPGLAQ